MLQGNLSERDKKKSVDRVLTELDSYLHKNDYCSAEKYLLSVLNASADNSISLAVMNELMGLYRKLGNRDKAIFYAKSAMEKIEEMGVSQKVGSATVYLNCATVYKAFHMAGDSIPLFHKAEMIYSENLSSDDIRWGGLYNNMALAYVDIKGFERARELYLKAIEIMLSYEGGAPEAAITYLNLADLVSEENGLLDGCEEIDGYLDEAQRLLDGYKVHDGNYAFVCEKCASVFGYYGRFMYEKELKERARKIYNERS